MDFQSLSRRELQALCKINKIPANMTNLAMAEALQSLQHVEGIEDFMRVGESEPHSQMIGISDLQDAPRSVCRTATCTKLAKEPESAATKTRGRPRTKIEEDMPYTPAVASRSRRAPVAASAAKNTESVACSTRRSMRLAVKQLSALSLNQKERTQPIKIDDMSNVQEEQEDNVMSDVDVKTVMEKGSETSIVSSIVSYQDSSEAVKTTLDSMVDVQEDKVVELYDVDVKRDADSEMSDVKECVVASEEILGGDVETKEVVSCEATKESDESTVAKLECTLEQKLDDEKAPLEKNDCDDLLVINGMADVDMSSDDVNVDIEEDLVVPSIIVESLEPSGECMYSVALPEENEAKSDCSEDYVKPELNIRNLSAAVVSTTETATATESVEEEFVMTETATKSVEEELVMTESATVSVKEEFVMATFEQSSTMATSSTPVMKMSPLPVISNLESKGKIPYSDWAVDPVMGQLPRPTHLSQRKSLRIEELMDINKENVDRSGGKLVHMIEISDEMKASTPLDKKSLRNLTKMIREKLQIQKNSKINNCQNVVQEKQLGKSKLALQAPPENNQE